MTAKNMGLTEQYFSPNADIIPEQFKDPDGYWIGLYVGALGFISNNER